MPPNPESRICKECDHRDDCNNQSADVCEKERREMREERAKPLRPNGLVCLAYIGFNYDHNDTSGRGYCIDTFDMQGHCAKCKDVLDAKRCPNKRTSPYEPDLIKGITR